ncbi:MAG: T9SS type A sorting domain-containing protein [Ignavibacteria bacterium]|nr:T9SS type A sorting domain-containing protein [Ignavibacteria bacterium]
MKKFMYTYIIISLTLLTGSKCFSQTWSVKWNSNGSPWIGGWHISNNDVYTKFKLFYPNTDAVFVANTGNGYNTNGWATIFFYNTSQNVWNWQWTNNGNHSLGGAWTLFEGDRFYPITINSSTYLFCLNTTGISTQSKAALIKFTGSSWEMKYNATNSSFPNWNRNNDDVYVIGNFLSSTPNDQEVLFISNTSRWGMLQQINNGTNWNALWSNNGSGSLQGWIIRGDDQYFAANLDGGPDDELVCINKGSGWCAIFKYQNSNWTAIWSNNGAPNVGFGGWLVYNNYNKYVVGNFNGDNKSDVLCVNSHIRWATIKNYLNQTYFPDFYTNYGSGFLNHGTNQLQLQLFLETYIVLNNNNIFSVAPVGGRAILQQFSYPCSKCAETTPVKNGEDIFNYPNPFNPSTVIYYNVKNEGITKINIYDNSGRLVKNLVNEFKPTGEYSVDFNAENLSSGIYYYKLEIGNLTKVNKMILVK